MSQQQALSQQEFLDVLGSSCKMKSAALLVIFIWKTGVESWHEEWTLEGLGGSWWVVLLTTFCLFI
jgi:hypothetical protein